MHNGQHKICVNVPFFHAFGMITQASAWHAGSTLILPAPTFNPVNSLDAIVKEKCSAVFGTPTMWVRTPRYIELLVKKCKTLEI